MHYQILGRHTLKCASKDSVRERFVFVILLIAEKLAQMWRWEKIDSCLFKKNNILKLLTLSSILCFLIKYTFLNEHCVIKVELGSVQVKHPHYFGHYTIREE